jgi:endonuclease YncB( thermonuclease family)
MNIRLTKSRQFALGLILFTVILLSACAYSLPSSPPIIQPAPAQAAQSTATSGQTLATRSLEGKVVGVADGDTITVLGAGNRQTHVRLQGIDAPESAQAFGQVSKRNLSDLIFGRQIVIEYEKTDRYGRTLGKVLVGGRDVNLEQIRAGLAWHYKHYQDEQSMEDRQLYADAETEARSARCGLWADLNPIPPWDFRRGKHGRAEEDGPAAGTGTPTSAPTPATLRRAEGQATGATASEGETVYVTRTGSKYHRSSCQYLRRSRIPVSFKEAKQSYDPCSVCKPPQ